MSTRASALRRAPARCSVATGCVSMPTTGRSSRPGRELTRLRRRASPSTRGRPAGRVPARHRRPASSRRCRPPRSAPTWPASSYQRRGRRLGPTSSDHHLRRAARPRASTDDGVAVTLSDADRLDSRGAWQGALPAGERTVTLPDGSRTASGASTRCPTRSSSPSRGSTAGSAQVVALLLRPDRADAGARAGVRAARRGQFATRSRAACCWGRPRAAGGVTQTFVPRGLKARSRAGRRRGHRRRSP